MAKSLSIVAFYLAFAFTAGAATNSSPSFRQNLANFGAVQSGNSRSFRFTLGNQTRGHGSQKVLSLQNFGANHHIDPSILTDLRSWLEHLHVSPSILQNFKTRWPKQTIDLGAIGHSVDDQTIDPGAIGHSLDQTIDDGAIGNCIDNCEVLAAVPEPSTVSSFLCGMGLLGGILLRFRSRR